MIGEYTVTRKRQGRKLPSEKIEQIRQMMHESNRKEVCRVIGISENTFYRYARMLNGGRLPWLQPKEQVEEDRELVRKLYPYLSGPEIDRALKWKPHKATTIAAQLGVKHLPETEDRIRRWAGERATQSMQAKGDELIEQRVQCWKRRKRLAELRVMSGEGNPTNYRIRQIPLTSYRAKYKLVSKHGYYECPDDPLVIYYDEYTDRRLKGIATTPLRKEESYYTHKYGLRFEPLPTTEESLNVTENEAYQDI